MAEPTNNIETIKELVANRSSVRIDCAAFSASDLFDLAIAVGGSGGSLTLEKTDALSSEFLITLSQVSSGRINFDFTA